MTAPRHPVFFFGHGSPMNAVADNAYTRALARVGRSVKRPQAILCISAHWQTGRPTLTAMARPKMIHDFYGFPRELFDVEYPAPGSPELARDIAELLAADGAILDESTWGLDHGAWSVLRHVFPEADIPIVQLSLATSFSLEKHFALGETLRALRSRDVLIVGSGNVVHNLREIDWDENAPARAPAVEFDSWLRDRLVARDHAALVNDALASPAGRWSHPTIEHYLPLLYVVGASTPDDALRIEYEGLQNASISMRSFSFGA